jgi:transposase
MKNQGYSYNQIAKSLGCAKNTVVRWVKRFDVSGDYDAATKTLPR